MQNLGKAKKKAVKTTTNQAKRQENDRSII